MPEPTDFQNAITIVTLGIVLYIAYQLIRDKWR